MKYSMDGPLLLHTMCHHIHRNHIVFVESIKDKIRHSTLAEHKDDMAVFLRFLQNNLRLISSKGVVDTSNNDLVLHILTQLCCSKIPLFQQTIVKWHRKYIEGKLLLTPLQLVQMANDESQILRHSNQWVETIDPTLTALQAIAQQADSTVSSQLHAFLANLPRLTQLLAAPDHNGRQWFFCTKCGRNSRWVCTHKDATHRTSDNYSNYYSMEGQQRQSSATGIHFDHDLHTRFRDYKHRDAQSRGSSYRGHSSSGRGCSPSPAPRRTPYEDPWGRGLSHHLPWPDMSPQWFPREYHAPRRGPFEDPGRSRSRSRSPSWSDRPFPHRRASPFPRDSLTQYHGRLSLLDSISAFIGEIPQDNSGSGFDPYGSGFPSDIGVA
jgi:hypothetical protein